jgi:hypothetical protein
MPNDRVPLRPCQRHSADSGNPCFENNLDNGGLSHGHFSCDFFGGGQSQSVVVGRFGLFRDSLLGYRGDCSMEFEATG